MIKDFLEKIESKEKQGLAREAPGAISPARMAIYDSLAVAPRVLELSADDYDELINLLATKTYQFSQEKGGELPFTVIKEVIENLIHAYFKEVVVTILDDGNTVRISDQGPGIINKVKAFEPGFSTATREMKYHIRGVGSGLPIAKEALTILGGAISVEDNLSGGTVVTIRMPNLVEKRAHVEKQPAPSSSQTFSLSNRQKQVLSVVMELSTAGPSNIARSLSVSLSTVYRDLLYLEELGLVESDSLGKRSLTTQGLDFLYGSQP